MTAAPLRLVFDATGDDLAAARACEAQVFLDAYGNTAEELAAEYGPYEANTGFLAVIDDEGEAVAAARLITPGAAGLKTLADVSRPPWEVDGVRSARAAGVDPERTWDVATIAVRPGRGRGGLCAAALYHGIIYGAYANDADHFVMIMDTKVRELVNALDIGTQPLPGTVPGEYLGSPSSAPLWADLGAGLEQMRLRNLDAYRLIFQGIGLDGISMPTDWTWRPRS
jgi:hypothetical protein